MRRLVAIAAALSSFSVGVGLTWALWSDSVNFTAERVTWPAVEIQLLDKDGTPVDEADGDDLELVVPFGEAEAEVIAEQAIDGVADDQQPVIVWSKPYQVVAKTTGTIGFGYTVELPDLSKSVYGQNLVLFPVDSWEACLNPGAPPDQPDEEGMAEPEAIPSTYGPDKPYSQWYCLTTSYEVYGDNGYKYENVATATVDRYDPADDCNDPKLCSSGIEPTPDPDPEGEGDPTPVVTQITTDVTGTTNDVTQSAKWRVGIIPDPVKEPTVSFKFNVNVFAHVASA
jgi:hypothetical protein